MFWYLIRLMPCFGPIPYHRISVNFADVLTSDLRFVVPEYVFHGFMAHYYSLIEIFLL